MNPQDPLTALQPLREPSAISWWPLAPGWWILLALILVTLSILAALYYRKRQRNAYRRRAAARLKQLFVEQQSLNDSRSYVTAVNALLKSVALKRYPDQDLAACSGQSWREFLNRSMPNSSSDNNFSEDLDNAVYQRNTPEINAEKLYRSAVYWIANHGDLQ